MRFHQEVKPFHFIEDGQPLQQIIKPVKLNQHPDLIERIYAKYPYVEQYQIKVVVLATFEVLRDLLLKGCILTIKKLMMNTRIHFFTHKEGDKIYPAVKVKVGTPIEWIDKESFLDD